MTVRTRLDAELLCEIAQAMLAALRAHEQELNLLNVYPVPDRDTGTNMVMTVDGAVRSLAALERPTGPAVAEAVTRGSMLGARGNAGLILSQILRGLYEALASVERAGPDELREGLRRAADLAVTAVKEPVEGTILTVVEAAAATVEEDPSGSLADLCHRAEVAAGAAVERTQQQLEPLRRAGVVDAGGRGLELCLQALGAVVSGRRAPVARAAAAPEAPPPPRAPDTDGMELGFEVQYLFESASDGVEQLKSALRAIGDSLVVVGADGSYKVHVHTNEPGRAVEEALGLGSPSRIQITSFAAQLDRAARDQAGD